MNSGYWHEAGQWRTWLRRAVAGSPQQVPILYGLAGERRLDESTIPWLSGYEKSKPVRIGNTAADQPQLTA
jgi:GH15 family glucan-1,4-alpha-glucosidase